MLFVHVFVIVMTLSPLLSAPIKTRIPLLDYYGQVRSAAHKKAPTMHPGAGGL